MKVLCFTVTLVAFAAAQQYSGAQPDQPAAQKSGGAESKYVQQFKPYPLPTLPMQPLPRDVCDFESFFYVASSSPNQGTYGFPEQSHIHRVKCADVAVMDDASCTRCCRRAARIRYSDLIPEQIGGMRVQGKMDFEREETSSYGPYLNTPSKQSKNTSEDKARCMCCAPREVPISSLIATVPQFGR
uniref:Secreted protein n=1 Tax=Steinernema glaseri TaxID=37863 RepID=A0A1I8AEW5_9BILA